MRKPIFGVSDHFGHKQDCTAPEDGLRLEISDVGGKRDCIIFVDYCTADLCLYFHICKNQVFSDEAHIT